MVEFGLDEEQQGIVNKFREFSDAYIVPNRMKYDASAEFPWDVVKAAYEHGIMNGPIPEKYGGHGFGIFNEALASEELGAGCIGIGICIDANTLALTPLVIAATEEQQKKFFGMVIENKGVAAYAITEPVAGSVIA